MKNRQIIFYMFIVCLIVILTIFAISQKNNFFPLRSIIQFIFSPVQKTTMKTFNILHPKSQYEQLKDENTALKVQLALLQLTTQDNKALRDQFQQTNPPPKNLIPASIVGMPAFIPGVNEPESLVIDKGINDGVVEGDAAVYKDNMIGVVSKSNSHFSLISVIGNKSTSFTAKTTTTGALGVVKGLGNGQTELDNVILSDTLEIGDSVVAEGNTAINGVGYPGGLVIGKITSVEKNPSSLFQRANVKSLIDIIRIPIVFIVIGEK